MSEAFQKTYQGRIDRALNASEKTRAERKALDDFFRQLTGELHKAGVGLLAGSDCGAYNSYGYPGISLHEELQALVDCGLSPLYALKTSAYNGAKFLKKEDDYGLISEGKIADLVLLTGNPLQNIAYTKSIDQVIKNGRVFGPSELEELLNDKQ